MHSMKQNKQMLKMAPEQSLSPCQKSLGILQISKVIFRCTIKEGSSKQKSCRLVRFLKFPQKLCSVTLTLSYLGGGAKYTPLLFFLHHPKTAQGMNLKLSDFKDTLLRHFLKVKPVRYILSCCHGNKITNGTSQNLAPKKSEKSVICKDIELKFGLGH